MKQILVRDYLQDVGQIPTPEFYSDSPDIIVHEQVKDPLDFFTRNYGEDLAEPFTRKKDNLLYVRARNLGAEKTVGYIRTYASKATLFMNPVMWMNNVNKSLSGKTIVETQPMAPGEIGVGVEPFVFNAKSSENYCHVAYVSDSGKEPDIPEEIESYGHFVTWVRYNRNVALRNFNVLSSKNMSAMRQECEFANPSRDLQNKGGFLFTMKGDYPVGTEIVMECEDMGLRECCRVEDEMMEHTFWIEKYIPPLFSGVLITTVYLPVNGRWPSGGCFSVSLYATEDKNEEAMLFSIRASQLKIFNKKVPQLMMENDRLIKIGTCSTKLID